MSILDGGQHQEGENDMGAHAGDFSEVRERTSPIPVVPQLSVAVGILVSVFGVTYIGATGFLTKTQAPDVRIDTILPPSEQRALPVSGYFDDVKLEGKAAIVWDVREGKVLFNKNADEALPLASVTKLMTALVVYEVLGPDEEVTVTLKSIQGEGDSGLRDGERFSVEGLADLTLMSSSNDGAVALGARAGEAIAAETDHEQTFVRAMNVKAEELGLTRTYFDNATGLDLAVDRAGAYGSARDIALLLEYIITRYPNVVALTRLDSATVENSDGVTHVARNTNEVIDAIDGLVASKTGFTRLAGGNLALAVNVGLNRPIIVIVLGSSQEGRFVDALDLIERSRRYVEGSAT